MRAVIVLFVAVALPALCQPGKWGSQREKGARGIRGGRHHMMPPPPFLQDLGSEAHQEFFRIVTNTHLTIAQQTQAILEWAEKYGVTDKVQEFHQNHEKMMNKMKENVTQLIAELPAALEKISAIITNKDLTLHERHSALKKLSKENPQLYRVLRFAMGQFMQKHRMHGRNRATGGVPRIVITRPPENFSGFTNGGNNMKFQKLRIITP